MTPPEQKTHERRSQSEARRRGQSAARTVEGEQAKTEPVRIPENLVDENVVGEDPSDPVAVAKGRDEISGTEDAREERRVELQFESRSLECGVLTPRSTKTSLR
jgi:hypothetical protein